MGQTDPAFVTTTQTYQVIPRRTLTQSPKDCDLQCGLGAVSAVSINVPVTIWCLVRGRKASAFHSTGLARRQFTLLKLCRNLALSQMSSPLFDDVTGDHVKNRRNRQRLPCTGLQCLLQLALSLPVFHRGLVSSRSYASVFFLSFLFFFFFLSSFFFGQSRPSLYRSRRSPVPRSPVCNPKDQFRRYHSNSL